MCGGTSTNGVATEAAPVEPDVSLEPIETTETPVSETTETTETPASETTETSETSASETIADEMVEPTDAAPAPDASSEEE